MNRGYDNGAISVAIAVTKDQCLCAREYKALAYILATFDQRGRFS